ncbi:MAG: RNA polymerase sigma-I factor [Bacillota bacterium]
MLPFADLEKELRKARAGDPAAREKILEELRQFVLQVVSRVCRRRLEWGRDDELSIGLMALNEAIDRYREERRVPFLAFARLLVKSRLTDYLRRQAREPVFLDGEEAAAGAEIARAREEHWAHEAALEREEEIKEFNRLLNSYGISFADLVKCSPKHGDTRRALLQAARRLSAHQDLMGNLLRTKRLPVLELAKLTGVHPKTLERGRKYIIAVALIWYHCEDFLYLCSYLKPAGGEEGER